MDVSGTRLGRYWIVALCAILLLGLALRLRGIHDPLLDHPGWRQGDTAAIARNFATLDLNPFHPQTDYDGPPPNYVELELQIVPWLAALAYKVFGVHEIFGRAISIGFSLGTIAALASFARWMFASRAAGLVAALAFAIYPGSVYYGRTFMPDTAMTFFLTVAVFASARWIVEDDGRVGRRFAVAAALTALAILAKPVALLALAPIVATFYGRLRARGVRRTPALVAFLACALAPYLLYDAYVASIAEWHWASGIARLHVLPELRASLRSGDAFRAKLQAFAGAGTMLGATMIGRAGVAVALIAMIFTTLRRTPTRSRALLWAWFAAALAYAYVVVTVEQVDYYLYPFLPLAALWTAWGAEGVRRAASPLGRRLGAAAVLVVALAGVVDARDAVAGYYHFNENVYREAKTLDAALDPQALVVVGHYDPSVLYYIGRKGWEEDPLLWTPFDEESAIKKGARYFVAIERSRLARNADLAAWLTRFPVRATGGAWPVYETVPAKELPGAEARWQTFRRGERARAGAVRH